MTDTVVPLSAPALLRSPSAKSNISAIDDLTLLTQILSWRRPHNTDAEGEFINRYIDALDTETDDFGNRFIRIGTAPLLYSCHLDTVHREWRESICPPIAGVLHRLRSAEQPLRLRERGDHAIDGIWCDEFGHGLVVAVSVR